MHIFARRELAGFQGSPGPCGRPTEGSASAAGSPGPRGRPPGGVTSRAQGPGLPTDEPALLLEGSWPDEERHHDRWALDDAINSRFSWIDRWAAKYAQQFAQQAFPSDDEHPTLAYLNELALRYFLVKLLRVVAFYDEVCPPTPGEKWHLHLAEKSDSAYAELFGALAVRHGVELAVNWHGSPGPCGRLSGDFARRAQGPWLPASRLRMLPWRRWAARAAGIFSRDPLPSDDRRPRVILCGNPRVLDPVCIELLARGCRVWWLYEEFAVRAWWRWRTDGVAQLLCDNAMYRGPSQRWDSLRSAHPTHAAGAAPPFAQRHGVGSLQMAGVSGVTCRGVRLDGAIACWLSEQAAKYAARQSCWLDRIDEHLRAVRPTALVLDEDATAFKRAAVAMARRHGARSLVVQHGAPCGPFGFAPLAADEICVWGNSTHEQLLVWGIADSRIHVTGWPALPTGLGEWPARPSSVRAQVTQTAWRPILRTSVGQCTFPRFLLLATVGPDDRRPDTVGFHLTTRNHAAMVEMACAAVSRFAGARLTIKLHPRTRDAQFFEKLGKCWRQLDIRLIQHGDTASLWQDADCVLSCASTAGIEAALAGAPVVQLLPEGSGDLLPADRWGLVGSARTLDEICPLINQALARGWRLVPDRQQEIAAETGPPAAAAIVDRVLVRVSSPVAARQKSISFSVSRTTTSTTARIPAEHRRRSTSRFR